MTMRKLVALAVCGVWFAGFAWGETRLWSVSDASQLTGVSVATATVRPGDEGTIYWGQLNPRGTMLLLR